MLQRYMTGEASPTLPPLPGIDLADYRRTLVSRFANPNIGDTLARNCTDGSDRIPKFVLPVVRDQLAAGGDISVAVTAVAAWARYLEAVDEQGRPYDVADRRFEAARPAGGSAAQPAGVPARRCATCSATWPGSRAS